MGKIERLKKREIVNGWGDSVGLEPPSSLQLMDKINEIIDYLNMDSPAQVGFENLMRLKEVAKPETPKGIEECPFHIAEHRSLTPFESALIQFSSIYKEPDAWCMFDVWKNKLLAIAREEFLDKACRWLKENTFKSDWPSCKVFLEFFRKAMEE